IMESAHLSHAKFFGNEVGAIPKGYLYFAIAFSLFVEFLNIRMQKNKVKPSEIKE
ncbi:MAG: TerC family protein, partial [Arenibacter sp.]